MKPRIALNIGNTTTEIGLIDRNAFTVIRSVKFPSTCDIAQMNDAIEQLSIDPSRCDNQITVASVRKGADSPLLELLGKLFPCKKINCIDGAHSLPFSIHYESPVTLGADRIADALYAFYRFSGREVIIVDAGTAIKVDLLSSAGFRGGIIMPGEAMMRSALSTGTVQLPLIDLSEVPTHEPIGQTTAGAIRLGIFSMVTGGTNAAVSRIRKQCNAPIILATGGAFHYGIDGYDFPYQYEPEVTLIGAGLFESF